MITTTGLIYTRLLVVLGVLIQRLVVEQHGIGVDERLLGDRLRLLRAGRSDRVRTDKAGSDRDCQNPPVHDLHWSLLLLATRVVAHFTSSAFGAFQALYFFRSGW